MKSAFLAIAALVATTSANAGSPAAPLVTITGSAQGSWEMLCHVTSSNGDETILGLGPDHASSALTYLRRATCNYKNSARGPLTVTFASSTFACPFKAPVAAPCEAQFTPGAFGSIEIRRKQ
ncbi:hypothetical protein [Novosphingobium lentum]|uniref:hypothetical protein n=1 Tax=Novosphingobium lentum TaxID=145287 RepID=UPI00082C8356|nr:hypothetical protein [Novosphingobium lentum]